MEALLAEDVAGAWAGLILPFEGPGRVALGALGEQLEALVEAGVEGLFAADGSRELADLEDDQVRGVQRLLIEAGAEAGLPVVFDGSAPTLEEALRRMARMPDLAPAAWLVCPLPAGDSRDQLEHLSALARAASPASLVLEEPRRGALGGTALASWAAALPQLVGARIQPRDEEGWAELAPVAEDLALFAAGREWAAASRWGARSSASELVALSPSVAAGFADLLEDDVQRALRLERRFLHFLEAHVLPLERRIGRRAPTLERLLALAGAWCPGLERGPDGKALGEPGLAPELGFHAEHLLRALDADSGPARGTALG